MVRLKIAYWEFDFEAVCPTLNHDLLSQAHIFGKWMQKEDIAKTAEHFVLKWVFEVNRVSNNSSNNSRMLETKDFMDIAYAYYICP